LDDLHRNVSEAGSVEMIAKKMKICLYTASLSSLALIVINFVKEANKGSDLEIATFVQIYELPRLKEHSQARL